MIELVVLLDSLGDFILGKFRCIKKLLLLDWLGQTFLGKFRHVEN